MRRKPTKSIELSTGPIELLIPISAILKPEIAGQGFDHRPAPARDFAFGRWFDRGQPSPRSTSFFAVLLPAYSRESLNIFGRCATLLILLACRSPGQSAPGLNGFRRAIQVLVCRQGIFGAGV
jgi:hypothetical protein